MKPKPTVGQTVWLLPINNAARGTDEPAVFPTTVKKVGRKYFTVSPAGRHSYDIRLRLSDWLEVSNSSADYKGYASTEEHYIEKESREIANEAHEFFSYRGSWKSTPFEDMQAIRKIIRAAKAQENAGG